MNKIKIGVILDQKITSGGGFQQSLNAILLINELQEDNVDIVFFTTVKENINVLSKNGISFKYIKISFINKFFSTIKSKFYHPKILNFLKSINNYSKFEKVMIRNNIDLIYFTSPSSLAKEVDKLNYILTVWDLNYLYNNEFPEFRENKITDTLHQFYQLTVKKATAVIVDSEMSRDDLATNYLISKNRVNIIPYEPGQNIKNYLLNNFSNNIDIKKKYNVKFPYIFYPAQFWPHKNHTYILRGIRILEDKFNIKISALFAGSDQGNIGFVKDQVQKLKLENQIHFIGFVDSKEIPIIYKQSIALVMPTFFGPTNIPPLEAFDLGVPVLYSDLKGLRDQVVDAALLMDLKNPESMALTLNNLINDNNLRETIIKKGYERSDYFKKINRVKILKAIIEDFKTKILCWKNLNDN
jgi:glycosyltransferase involved in cell wall biosynthesis